MSSVIPNLVYGVWLAKESRADSRSVLGLVCESMGWNETMPE